MSGGIGVVGGGQLAWMLADAALQQGVDLHVQTPRSDDPATRLATSVVLAPADDVEATRSLATRSVAITFENEWVDLDALAQLHAEGVTFVPGLDALRPLLSKRSQRAMLDRLFLPSPRWVPLEHLLAPPPPDPHNDDDSGEGAQGWTTEGIPATYVPPVPFEPRLPEGFGFPVMAKAITGGYDGRGTLVIRSQQELIDLIERVDPAQWLLEEFVAFEQELALVACRDRNGAVSCYPLVQTHQHRQICDWVLAPAAVDHAVVARARNVAASLLTSLDYAGVLSIEFFYGPCGLLINEIAPRTHNSGHYTIEAARTSQFAQQVRIVRGLPLGDTELKLPGALMVNLLGFETSTDSFRERRQALAALPGAALHWYGKRDSLPGRKLGHITLSLQETAPERRREEARSRLADVRGIWPLPPDERP